MGEWLIENLSPSGKNEWSGQIPASLDFHFFIQAVDMVGNVAVADNKGGYYGTVSSNLYLPMISR